MILAVGVVSILAGVLYTGGPRPYGYAGLGEAFVFLFFGLVAVNGSYFVQLERLDWLAFALSIPVGMLATAILVVNNLRDIETDRRVGKRTLAVRLGRERTRGLYAGLVVGAYVVLAAGLVGGRRPGMGPARAPLRAARRASACRRCGRAATGPASTPRSPAPACCSPPSASCSRAGCWSRPPDAA